MARKQRSLHSRKSPNRKRDHGSRPAPVFSIPDWVREAGCIAALLLAVVVFYWAVLTEQAFLWEDVPEQWYPFASYTASELSMGRLPLWNPYLFGGIPFLAMIDVGVLYPLNWLLVPFVEDNILDFLAVEYHIIAHVFLIGVSTYLSCRVFSLSTGASLIGALVYMLCGTTVHNIIHPVFVFGVAWFPLVFIVFRAGLASQRFDLSFLSGGLLGVLILAGHAQVFVYVSYFLACYLVFRTVTSIRVSGFGPHLIRMGMLGTIPILTALALASGVLLPMFELTPHALRPDVTYEVATSYARYPQELVTFLMPYFFGRTEPALWQYWGPGSSEYGHFWETHAYLGILPLVLASVAIVFRRDSMVLFFSLTGFLFLLLSFGDNSPLYWLAYEIVPGFDRFRGPARFSLLFGYALAVLCAYGVDTLNDSGRQISKGVWRLTAAWASLVAVTGLMFWIGGGPLISWLSASTDSVSAASIALSTNGSWFLFWFFMSVSLVLFWVRGGYPRPFYVIAAAILVFADLHAAGSHFANSPKSPGDYYPRSELIRFLQDRQSEEGGRARTRQDRFMMMTRNSGVLYRVNTLEGYASPLRLAETVPPLFGDELMDVRYRIQVESQGNQAQLVPNQNAVSPAFIVRDYVLAGNSVDVAAAMSDSAFRYSKSVVLYSRPDSQYVAGTGTVASESAEVTFDSPSQVTVQVNLESPGIVVVSEVFYPSWKAYLNGNEVEILRANQTMRAVLLPAGGNSLVMRYESNAFSIGITISCLTLLGLIFTGLVTARRAD